MQIGTIVLTALLILAILGGILVGIGWGIQDTRVSAYTITGVNLDDGLVIEGVLEMHNPSRLPLPIERIPYTVSSDGGVLANGEADGFLLSPGYSETNLTFVLTGESVVSALRSRSASITVNGTIEPAVPVVPSRSFSDTRDLSSWADALRNLLDPFGGESS